MRRRKHLGDAHWPFLQLIIEGKREPIKGQLLVISERLTTRFAEYEDHFDTSSLGQLPRHTWTLAERRTLLHCYDSPGAALSRLKAEILDAQIADLRFVCPYCGVGISDEFDHYAPKERYPHLAVHALNLVPCCGRCNRTKSKAWLNDEQEREVLHFYIDDIPSEPYLFASLSWSDSPSGRVPRATFRLIRPKNYSKTKFALIERHYERMKLLRHFRDHAHRGFVEVRKVVRLFGPTTNAQVSNLTHKYAVSVAKDQGSSHWQVVLFRALADDPEFAESVRE